MVQKWSMCSSIGSPGPCEMEETRQFMVTCVVVVSATHHTHIGKLVQRAPPIGRNAFILGGDIFQPAHQAGNLVLTARTVKHMILPLVHPIDDGSDGVDIHGVSSLTVDRIERSGRGDRSWR